MSSLASNVRTARLVLLATLLAGCAGTVETRTDSGRRDDEKSSSTKASLHTNKAAADLEQGRQAVSEGRFDAALAAFQAAYASGDAKPDHKASALLGMGQVYSNVLNPKRDVDKALLAYRRLIADYPDSKLKEEAERAVASLEASR